MDLSLTDEQQASAELAKMIFDGQLDLERRKDVEDSYEAFDHDLWQELAKADLLGLCLPEAVGGAGFGLIEACLLLTELGRAVAPVPLLATLAYGALPIARFGTEEQQKRWLTGVASGDTVLTGAYAEPDADPRWPTCRVDRDGEGFCLQGTKTGVPFAHVASAMVVSARLGDNPALVVIDPRAPGVTLDRQRTTNLSPEFLVHFDSVSVGAGDTLAVGATGRQALDHTLDVATIGCCAVASGVAQEALRITAEYTSTRKQFDRPIGTFQAVGQRMADCFQYRWAIELTMLQAATLLEAGDPAADEVAVAKYWAAWGGNRIAHAGLHVHGGISIDRDYAIHRYFRWAKQLEYTLGGASAQLARIGAALAS